MKKKNPHASGANIPVCRSIIEAGSTSGDSDNSTQSGKSDGSADTRRSGQIWKLKRIMPSLTVILVIATLISHMTFGGGAALVPTNIDGSKQDTIAEFGLAYPEAMANADYSFSRGSQDVTVQAQETSGDLPVPVESEISETIAVEVTEPEETLPVDLFEEADEMVFIQAERVNVRAEATTDAEVLTILSYGQSMRQIGISEEWSRIELEDGMIGYIVSQYIDSTPPPTPTPSGASWPTRSTATGPSRAPRPT